jgi:hypothetical protein
MDLNEFKSKEMRGNPSTDQALTVNGREVEQVKIFYISWQRGHSRWWSP